MTRPRTYRTEALVLRQAPLGEADLLVTLLAPEQGKLRAVARGARRVTSRLVGHLEPLTRVDLAVAKGRTLDVITQAQGLESFAALKGDLEAISHGIYVAELADGFAVEGSGNPPLYSLTIEVLRLLRPGASRDLLLRYYELHLLKLSGFLPELYRCVECRGELEPGEWRFTTDGGGVLCHRCTSAHARTMTLSMEALETLRFLERARPEHALHLRTSQAVAQEMGAVLGATVRYWLDREVRSADFLQLVSAENGKDVLQGIDS